MDEERVNHGLSDKFKFSYFTALSRIRRKNLSGNGTGSPLLEIEDELVDLILCMSKIKWSLSVSEGLHLCNQLIADTDIQKKLIDFKLSRNIFSEVPEDLGTVGRHYWKKFLKRNKQRIRSKTPKKIALDRTQWTTYMNFDDMYHHVEEVMIDSNIAERLPEPQWMDASGRVVDNEHEGNGYKVEVDLKRPDMALVLDEVGCNTSQETDNAIGGELLLTGRDEQAYWSVVTPTNHFTVLGVTALSGDPVLCVVIISGKKGDIPVSTGVDWNAVEEELNVDIEEGDEIKFLNSNIGPGKMFPGGGQFAILKARRFHHL